MSKDPWDFKSRMKQGEVLWGAMITLPSATVAEVLVHAGFDWFFIDGEHGALGMTQIQDVLQAVDHRITCLVRVPEASEVYIKKVLDMGAHGIIVPQVNDRETVENIVRWSKYSPEGSRGVGLARAHGYGSQFKQYVSEANDKLSILVQAEHKLAVQNIEDIVSVPGVDAIQLGPYDLSASMGMMGAIDAPEVQTAIERVCTVCKSVKMPIASFGVGPESLSQDIQRGVTMICAGTDSIYLKNGAESLLKKIKLTR